MDAVDAIRDRISHRAAQITSQVAQVLEDFELAAAKDLGGDPLQLGFYLAGRLDEVQRILATRFDPGEHQV